MGRKRTEPGEGGYGGRLFLEEAGVPRGNLPSATMGDVGWGARRSASRSQSVHLKNRRSSA